MPRLIYSPMNTEIDVEPNTKILAAAIRNKVQIQFGCAACRCGTCGIKVSGDGALNEMEAEEIELLKKMGLDYSSGTIRLACKARAISGEIRIDLDFQATYSPDQLLSGCGLPK